MEDFFEKIKKKFSVDNILDLMKDGKLKEEIKQTLTAKVKLNEKPRQDEVRATPEGSTNVESNKLINAESLQAQKTGENMRSGSEEQLSDRVELDKNNFSVLQKPNTQPQTKSTDSMKKSEEVTFYD